VLHVLSLLKVLSEDSVEQLCALSRLVSPGDDLSDVKSVAVIHVMNLILQ